MDILLDLNIIIDLLIPLRKGYPIAKEIDKIIKERHYRKWISASSIDTLYYILLSQAKKFNIRDGERLLKLELGKLLKETKIFSVTGASVLEAINFEDLEDYLLYTNFKRIAPDGIIISNDKKFQKLPDVISSKEFIERHRNPLFTKKIQLLDLQEEYRYMIEEIDHAVLKNIAKAQYILGPEVEEIEDKIAQYIGVKHCIGCSSGTEALVLSLRALAIKIKEQEYFDKNDKIITTPFTFTATGDAILHSGATPVFVDIDLDTYNIDPKKIREYLMRSKNVVGIIPVHLYGHPANMGEIMQIAKEYNLFVIEDVAQAFGSMWNGKKLGSIGTTGCFSFFPSKNLGGFGDGGMVSTNDNEIAEIIRMLIKHGGKDKYNVEHIGYNARLDTLQASILLTKFKYVDEFNERRRKIAEIYNRELKNIREIVLPKEKVNSYHVYHQYTIRVRNGERDKLKQFLQEKGISSMVYYPLLLKDMKVFNGKCEVYGDLKNAEEATKEVLSLPIEPLLKEEEIFKVINTIKEFFEVKKRR
jgi:dTDP-4-amino-4,6-dideoxygalactose transaminase